MKPANSLVRPSVTRIKSSFTAHLVGVEGQGS
jgi:hypothetical protein